MVCYNGIVFITAAATDSDAVQAFGGPGAGSVDQSELAISPNGRDGYVALSVADFLQSSTGMQGA